MAYEGATVLEPKAGYYATPVATLDFASLYPSIMMAHNLCYTTLLPRGAHASFPATGEGARAVESPSGERFVKPELQAGVLPEILRELLSARKRCGVRCGAVAVWSLGGERVEVDGVVCLLLPQGRGGGARWALVGTLMQLAFLVPGQG